MSDLPPVQQAYFKKRGIPLPPPAPRPRSYAAGSSATDGYAPAATSGHTSAAATYSEPTPVYTAQKVKVEGGSYYRTMALLQTLLLLGIFICLAAMTAKAYQSVDVSSSRSRF